MDIWQIKQVKLGDLIPNAKNPRKISQEKLAALQDKIERLGFHNPIKTDENMQVLGGNQRLKALLKIAGKDLIVPIMVPNRPLTEEEKQEVIITDNISDGQWDWEKLSKEWDKELTASWGLDWTECDFDAGEETQTEVVEDEVPEEVETRCKRGDIWKLGEHRMMCGDSTCITDVEKLMNGEKADLLLTDPPYNVAYEGKTEEKLTIKNDKQDDSQFLQFLNDCFSCAFSVLKEGASFYVWHADSEGLNFRLAIKNAGLTLKQNLIWVKNSMVLGRQDYQCRHEPCLYGWKEGAAHNWYSDRKQTTILEFDRPTKSKEHPTMKPIALFAYQLCNSTQRGGGLVLDLFGGSGTSIIASEQTGRKCYTMELDEHYCDVILTRWENLTGKKAELLK